MMSIISSSPEVSAESRKSFLLRKAAPVGQVLLQTWKKNRSLSIIALILMIIALPVIMLLSSGDGSVEIRSLYMLQTALMVPFMIVMTMVSAIMSFSYLHSRSAIDVTHALPVRRFPLLTGRFLGGLLPVLVAQWVAYALLIIETKVANLLIGIDFVEIITAMGKLQLMTVAVYAVCVLAFFLTGTLFDAIMMMVFLNGAWPLTVLTLNIQLSEVLPGFVMNGSRLADLALLFSPWARSFVIQEMNLSLIISWLAIIFAVMLWTIWLNHRRPSELAGRSYAIRPPVWLMQWVACLLGGLLMGQLFYEMPGENIAMFIPGVIIGMITAHLVIEAMVSRGLKSLVRSLPRLAILTVIMAGGMTIVSMGAFGFVERVPAPEEVKSVQLMISDLPYYNYNNDADSDKNLFRTPENINAVVAIHQTALEQISEMISAPYSVDSINKLDRTMSLELQTSLDASDYDGYSYNIETVRIVYQLKNGRKMERSYRLPLSDTNYTKLLAPMKETTEYKLLKYPVLSEYPMTPNYLTVMDKLGETRVTLDNFPQDLTDLQAALRKDLLINHTTQPSEVYGSLNILFTEYNANVILSDQTPAVMEVLREMGLFKDEFEQTQSAYASVGIFSQTPDIVRQRMTQLTAAGKNSQDLQNVVYFDPYMIGEISAEAGKSLENILIEIDDQDLVNQIYAAGKPSWPEKAGDDEGYLVVFFNYYGEGDKMMQGYQFTSYAGPMPCLYLPAESLPDELRQQLDDMK
jgi:hypothetical protein